jgi:hypothetical protein
MLAVPPVRLMPAPALAQPRRWNIAVVRTTTMEHCRGYAWLVVREGAW